MEELHLIIQGKVQGVWFRAWTRDVARELGVTGWVRNRNNGSVEALAQGDKAHLEHFLERVSEGPPLARVSRIDPSWRNQEEQFASFEVRT